MNENVVPVQMRDYYSKLSEIDLVNYEEKHNIKIPEQYRKFLLEYNGGYTEKVFFKLVYKEKSATLVLNEIHGIHSAR